MHGPLHHISATGAKRRPREAARRTKGSCSFRRWIRCMHCISLHALHCRGRFFLAACVSVKCKQCIRAAAGKTRQGELPHLNWEMLVIRVRPGVWAECLSSGVCGRRDTFRRFA